MIKDSNWYDMIIHGQLYILELKIYGATCQLMPIYTYR